MYERCIANLFNAAKRQSIGCEDAAEDIQQMYIEWFNSVIMPEIEELLCDFEYSLPLWYNHLTAAQQAEVDPCFTMTDEELKTKIYSLFCKIEKQAWPEGEGPPKNRAISGPNREYKYVMGPICYALEQYFKKFKGYCGGKNWEEQEQLLNDCKDRGLTLTVEGDGSAFDRTQKIWLKILHDFQVYKFISNKIKHVNLEVFLHHALMETNRLALEMRQSGGSVEWYGYLEILGQVMSGNCDTTLMNTFRMACYNRFVIERIMQIPRDDYELACKGDDSRISLHYTVDKDEVVKAYYTVFARANKDKLVKARDIKHGIGQIMKFLKISDMTDIDFCSTETYWCEGCNSFKITRQLKRFITLTPYSNSMLSLDHNDRLAYMQALCDSNEKWCKGLPIYRVYNDMLRTKFKTTKINGGRQRKLLPLGELDLFLAAKFKTKSIDHEVYIFGRDMAYGLIDRLSAKKDCCVESYYTFLYNNYNLTRNDIHIIEKEIINCGESFHSDLLEEAFQERSDRYSALMH